MPRPRPGALPPPPVPADGDLRSFRSMMIDVREMLDGDVAAVADPEIFRITVLCLYASWHQRPAGSLPDDDSKIMRLIGFTGGANVFRKLRAAGGMHGWFKADDGRLYHSLAAETVNEALSTRQAQRARTASARAAIEARKEHERMQQGTSEEHGGDDGGTSRESGGNTDQQSAERQEQTPPAQPVESAQSAKSVTDTTTGPVTETVTGSKRSEEKEGREGRASSSAGARVRRSDPPEAWRRYSTKSGKDRDGVMRPEINGYFPDVIGELICVAAKIPDENWAGDWETLVGWLRAGFDPNAQVIPTIQRIASRPSYQVPSRLSYFDAAIREQTPRERPC